MKLKFGDLSDFERETLVFILFKGVKPILNFRKFDDNSRDYKQEYFSKFMNEKIEIDPNAYTQKRDVNEEFRTWFLANEGKDVPKGRELFDFLEKKFGAYNRRYGWKGFKIIYDNCSSDDD